MWYSDHLTFRWETEKILQGQFAMANDASGMNWDLAWGTGAVQQIWGLGIPLWRVPFEWIAKVFGQEAFPDRLEFMIALLGVAYFIIRFHISFLNRFLDAGNLVGTWIGLVATLFFPPFITLCSSRFLVYEEVVAYGFLLCLLLMAWTVQLWFQPSGFSYLGLAMVSGLTPLVRPTMGAYGMASFLIATLICCIRPRKFCLFFLGACLFCAGMILLLWTNAIRFGSPFEFGHALAVNAWPSMAYAARFDNPYHTEPFFSAARELFGLLFLTKLPMNPGSYETITRSATFRWRELYFTTFDLSIVLFGVTACILLMSCARSYVRADIGNVRSAVSRLFQQIKRKDIYFESGDQRRHSSTSSSIFPFCIIYIWSLVALVPLMCFFLRFPFLSSRYLLFFGPAFSSICLSSFLLLFRAARVQRTRRATVLFVAIITGWWVFELRTSSVTDERHASTLARVLTQMKSDRDHSNPAIPTCYTNDSDFDATNIRFNGIGWNPDGTTLACITLFVSDPNRLVLDIAPTDKDVNLGDYNFIQAKVGRELLHRERIQNTSEGVRIFFSGPIKSIYKKGVQMISIATMSPKELSTSESRVKLLRVEWH